MNEIFEIQVTENMEEQFKKIAYTLINNYYLLIDNAKFQLVDIEFYLKDEKNIHNDIFTHCNDMQKTKFQWYLHRKSQKIDNTITNGTRKGIDFTFGSESYYAGMLIRAIRSEDKCLSEGPSLCVDRIMNRLNVTTLEELSKKIENKSHLNTPLKFEKKDKNSDYFIYFGKRYGLGDTKQSDYLNRHYRFILIDKNTKGIKDKLLMAKNAISQRDIEAIQEDLGYKAKLT
jgi:hypothetical protein